MKAETNAPSPSETKRRRGSAKVMTSIRFIARGSPWESTECPKWRANPKRGLRRMLSRFITCQSTNSITWPIQKIGRHRAVPKCQIEHGLVDPAPVDLELGHRGALKSEPQRQTAVRQYSQPAFAVVCVGACQTEGGQTFQQSAKRDRSAEIHCALEILAAIRPIRQSWRGFSHAAGPRRVTLDSSGHETTHVVTLQQQRYALCRLCAPRAV